MELASEVASGRLTMGAAKERAVVTAEGRPLALWDANDASMAAADVVEHHPLSHGAKVSVMVADLAEVAATSGSVSGLPWAARLMARVATPRYGPERVLRATALGMPPYLRGLIAFAEARPEDAVREFTDAVARDVDAGGEDVWWAHCQYWLGLSQRAVGDDAAAESALIKALSFYEAHLSMKWSGPVMAGRCRYALVKIYWRRGQRREALEALDAAMPLLKRGGDDEALGEAYAYQVLAGLALDEKSAAQSAATAGVKALAGRQLRVNAEGALVWLQGAEAELLAADADALAVRLRDYAHILDGR